MTRSTQNPGLPLSQHWPSLIVPGESHWPVALVGSVDCSREPTNPSCTIQVGTPGDPGSPGSTTKTPCHGPGGEVEPCYIDRVGWLGADGCYWRALTPAELAQSPDLFPPPAPPGQWYIGSCGTPPSFFPIVKYQVFNGPPNAAVLADAAVKALRLPAPVIRLNPAPPPQVVVGLPTWVVVRTAGRGGGGRRPRRCRFVGDGDGGAGRVDVGDQ